MPASPPRSTSRSPGAARSSVACAATAPAARRCSCCPTSTSCPRRRTSGPTTRSRATLADGWIYGRGAVDMKDLVAMELEVMRLLAAEARAAGRDPASDPVPGLRRDVLFASTADEEAGGVAGAGWLALEHPEHLRAAAAINEAGGVAVVRRLEAAVPDPGRREGHDLLPPHVPRHVGPRLDAARGQRGRPGGAGGRAAHRAVPGADHRRDPAIPGGGDRRDHGIGSVDCPAARRARDRRSGCVRHGHDRRLPADLCPGARRDAARHALAERGPRGREVQRHPGHRGARDRLPAPAGHLGGRPGSSHPRPARAGARGRHRHRADGRVRRARRTVRRTGWPVSGPGGRHPRRRSGRRARCR